ncbi:MAG: hypothetical protein KY433_12865, partial [Actinobacteria bacterium]|nr:hypothetical protein [Actinomycetota bacterium]
MKLRRQRSKRDQALDAVASVAKTWSEWRLGEKVSKTASKASKKAAKKASKASLPQGAKRKPVKIAGMLALVGGIGAAVAALLAAEGARVVDASRSTGVDVTSPDAPAQVADLAAGPVDILVNNAGT